MNEEKQDELQACAEKVEELAAENAELRESAESFGALAERLNQARQTEAAATADKNNTIPPPTSVTDV